MNLPADTMSEKQKIEAILAGSIDEFGYFVDTYRDMAITISFRICGNTQDAEDIVQNAFVKAYHSLASFRGKSKFSSWFYRIVYNTSLNAVRNKNTNKEYIDFQYPTKKATQDLDALQTIEEHERNKMINAAMSKLHPSESMVLTLYYMEDFSTKEIANITGLSKANVKIKLHRGRQNLSNLLSKTLVFD